MKRWRSPASLALLLIGSALVVTLGPAELKTQLMRARNVVAYDPLLRNIAATLIESAAGFTLGAVLGLAAGLGMTRRPAVRHILRPLIGGAAFLPLVALAPLVAFHLGHGLLANALFVALLCFLAVARCAFRAWGETAQDATPGGSRPALFAGLRRAAAAAVGAALVVEFLGADRGLGFAMLQATYNLDAPRLYRCVALACAIALVAVIALVLLERVLAWRSRRAREASPSHHG